MSQFSFDLNLTYDDSSSLLCATLVPQFDEPPLCTKHVSAMLKTSDYKEFYVYESTLAELITQSDVLRDKGQKLYEEYVNRLKKVAIEKSEVLEQAPGIENITSVDTVSDVAEESLDNSTTSLDLPESEEASIEQAVSPEKVLAMLGEQETSFYIAECLDASINIEVSEDDLEARLSIARAYGGNKATESSILGALEKQGISFGIDKESIVKALESETCSNILIAAGLKPTKGKDSKFEPLVSEQISWAPKIDEKGKANYHDINEFVIVEPGTQLMRRAPPGKGKTGTDIFGKVIPSIPGEILPFSGDSVGSSVSDDANVLVATAKGHPLIKARGVSVENVLVLNNVGLSTGNVDFDGSVCVNEDVADGVIIEASGDVTVKGVVGKATIIAGGNIVILQGLLGGSKALQDPGEEPYGAYLTSKGSVSVHFATRSQIRADKKIVIAEYSSHCDLYAQEQILIGQSGGKGNLFGGTARAFKLVAAKVIGSTGGTTTHIQVGGEADNIVKLRRISKEKRQNSESTYDVNEALHQINLLAKSAGITPQMKEKVSLLKEKLDTLESELRDLTEKDQAIKKILVRSKKARVLANKRIYNNTTVSILGAYLKRSEETKGCSFKFEGRKVVCES